jgi:hypothetical protein
MRDLGKSWHALAEEEAIIVKKYILKLIRGSIGSFFGLFLMKKS